MDNNKLFYSLPLGIVYQNPQGAIIAANPAAEKILGISIDQMQGKKSIDPHWRTIKEDGSDFPGEEHPAMMALKNNKPINNVIMGVFHPKKNDHVWIEINAIPQFKEGETKPYQVYTTFTDITKRILSTKALSKSDENSRSLLENIRVSILIVQGKEIKYANEEILKILSFSREELIGSEWSKFVYHKDVEFVLMQNKNRLEGKKVLDSFLARSIHKNGNPIWFQVEISNTSYNNNPALLVTMTNVDEKMKSNEELQQRLKFEEKIASISSRFIASKNFDDAIIKSFQNLAELNEASRVYLFHINYETQTLSNTHEWCNQGVTAEKDNLQNLPLADFTWWTEKLKNDDLIKIEDVGNMPAKAKNEQEILQAQNIHSLLAVPIYIKNELYGFIGFDNLIPLKLWTANDETLIHLYATILSNAIIRRLDEKALKRSESKFRKLFDSHLAVNLLIDPNTGKIIGANNAASEFYGWSISELTSMNIDHINVLPKEEKKQVMRDSLEKKQNYFEFEHKLKNGDVRFVNVYSGHIFEDNKKVVYSIIFDVTENKKAELQLRLISKAVSESPISTAITNYNAEIEFVNNAYTQITGYSEKESIGKNPRILNSGKQTKEYYNNLWNTILKGEIWYGELQNKTKSGEIIWVRTIISPIIDNKNSKISHFIWIQENITEKKALWEELVTSKEKAEESDRLKSAFLATMNHELRTPLNHILGFSELIPDMTDDKSISKFAAIIHESGTMLLAILEDIFDLALLEQSDVTIRENEVYVRDIYIELKKQLQAYLNDAQKQESIKLNFKIDSLLSIKKIKVDQPKITQIISNLIRNAVKFTQKGFISLEIKLIDKNILTISIKDTGIGIPKDKYKLIFEFFRQADDSHTRKHGGVGIGLAISEKIAIAIGGNIKVNSEQNVGSEFTFSLPVQFIKTNDPYEIPEKIILEKIPDLSSHKILIVEDDELSMALTTKMINETKCKVLKAVNGKEGVEIFKKNTDIDFILMDIKMPVMDGIKATQEIRKISKDIPIVAFSAHTLHSDKNKALDAGCNDVLTKPLIKELLFNKFEDYIRI